MHDHGGGIPPSAFQPELKGPMEPTSTHPPPAIGRSLSRSHSTKRTFEALGQAYPLLPVLVGGRGAADDPSLSFPLPPLTADRIAVCAEVERLLL
ncbi:MAG: hypothetical protein ACO1OB_06320, partial [Archangium sp.]